MALKTHFVATKEVLESRLRMGGEILLPRPAERRGEAAGWRGSITGSRSPNVVQ